MSNKFYKVRSDLVVIGSISGSKKDAVSFVEAQILKYAKVPNDCHYAIKKMGGGLFHFEIQERSKSGSILNKLIKEIEKQELEVDEPDPEGSDIFIYDRNDRQYQIYKRKDGTLRTFVRSHDEVVFPSEEGIENLTESSKPFSPYFSPLKTARNGFMVAFGISTIMAIFAFSLSVTLSSIDKGYVNAIDDSPSSLLLDERVVSHVPVLQLPFFAGIDKIKEFSAANPDKVISKLVFDGSAWLIEEMGASSKGVGNE